MSSRTAIRNAHVVLGLLLALFAIQFVPSASAQTVLIGGSMDRGLTVRPGNTIRAGYQVSLDDHGNHSGGAGTLSVANGVVIVTISCSNGKHDDDDKDHGKGNDKHDGDDHDHGKGNDKHDDYDNDHGKGNDKNDKNHGPDHETIRINLSSRTFAIPANGNFSSNENDYQGQTTAPSNLCGGKGGTTDGATFSTNSAFTCHANAAEGCCHKVCFRFHVLYNNHGGTFSHKDCEKEKQCASPTKHGNGHCCDKDKDRD